jgi:hypothetical protein
MRSIKNRVSTLERTMGLDSVPVDTQYDFLSAERLELAVACSEAFKAGREADLQELQRKLADNAEALWKYPCPPLNVERLIEALERARNDKRR